MTSWLPANIGLPERLRNALRRAGRCSVVLTSAPIAARETIDAVEGSDRFLRAGDAGITLQYPDEGIFKPD